MTFTLVMVENPHVWKRAQADIDAVVGTDRLPEFDDRPSLPYIDAIIREVIRWRPALPLGTVWKQASFSTAPDYPQGGPHSLTRSDVYDGYYIPKGMLHMSAVSPVILNVLPGAIVLQNVWYAHAPASVSAGRFIVPVGQCHATKLGILMQTNTCQRGS